MGRMLIAVQLVERTKAIMFRAQITLVVVLLKVHVVLQKYVL